MIVRYLDLDGWVDFVVVGNLLIVSNQISPEGQILLQKELSHMLPIKPVDAEVLCYVIPQSSGCPA